MQQLQHLEPKAVFSYFEAISQIPRGSGNEKAISDSLVSFAKEHQLEVYQDEAYNVLIRKPATLGYENQPCIVIQGHMDMVCEKTADSTHDFEKDPLPLKTEGDFVFSDGTTLGGDDGIAIAMMLALLASDSLSHPRLECLMTTAEETGMDGAYALHPSWLTGRTLLNIDSEDEGIFTVSCAGGCSAHIHIPLQWEIPPAEKCYYQLTVEGLSGGHSGTEIHKGKANAVKLLVRFLQQLPDADSLTLCSIQGGQKHNAIPRTASAVFGIPKQSATLLPDLLRNWESIFQQEYLATDPQITLTCTEASPTLSMSDESRNNVLQCLYLLPDGVQRMSQEITGLVETSLNLGIVETQDTALRVISSIRSSIQTRKEELYQLVATIGSLSGGTVKQESIYPAWQYRPDSAIRQHFQNVYTQLYGKAPVIEAIHAGLECGIFDEKFDGEMDMISFGPNLRDIHTPQERLSISSTQRTWDLLTAVLASL